jgi:hypothetical protein
MRHLLEELEFRQLMAAPTFLPPAAYETGLGANPTVTTGDFNGDGALDLAVSAQAGVFAEKIAILMNNGVGTFAAPNYVNAPLASGRGAVAGDLNHDGKADLVYNRTDGIGILLSNGASFTPGATLPLADVTFMTLANVNADAHLDLIASTAGAPRQIVLALGNGAGGFAAPVSLGNFNAPAQPLVADFNLDGTPDLAIVEASTVSVLPGNGDGTFQAPQLNFIPFGEAISATAADIDNQRGLDLIVTATIAGSDQSFIGLNDGFGNFTMVPSNLGAGAMPGDLDHDGDVDLVSTDTVAGVRSVVMRLNVGTGFFEDPIALPSAGPGYNTLGTLADFNRDMLPDIVTLKGADLAGVNPTGVGVILSPKGNPIALIENLRDSFLTLANGTLNKGNTNALDLRLANSIDSLNAGDKKNTARWLDLFIKLADNLDKKSPGLTALIDQAKFILTLL